MNTIALIVSAIMAAAVEASQFWPNGNAECPCIDPFANGGSSLDLAGHGPQAATASCSIARAADGYCFSSSYGAGGCKMHDQSATPECTGSAAEDWCDNMWCYVDPRTCNRPKQQSAFFPNATWAGSGLTFSYETCGFVNSFESSQIGSLRAYAASQVHGKLRIAFPNNDMYHLKLVADGTGVGGSNCIGELFHPVRAAMLQSLRKDFNILRRFDLNCRTSLAVWRFERLW